MRPDWASEDEVRATSPTPTAGRKVDLPIVDSDEGEDFDDDEDDDDDEPEDDDPLELEIDSEPRTVLITGACGNIGRKLRGLGRRL